MSLFLKRSSALAVSIFILILSLTGCGSANKAGDSSQVISQGTAIEKKTQDVNTEVSDLPIVKEPLTLSMWLPMNANVAATMTDYNEIAAHQELEKGTGIKIDFQLPPAAQAADALNILLASGNLPDMIYWWANWASIGGGPDKLIQDNVILKLNDPIEKYAKNLKKIYDDNPEYKKLVITDSGNHYIFPFIRGDKYLTTYAGMTVRKDWLDKVNMGTPVTIDDWYNVLKAFKNTDLNGNEKADEIPLLINLDDIAWCHAFISAWGLTAEFYNDGGTVKYGPVQPDFKNFVELMKKWYDEGLLDPDFATTDAKLKDAKITNNQIGATLLLTGSGIGKYANSMPANVPGFKLVGTPYPVLKAGDKPVMGQKDAYFSGMGVVISAKSKHVEEAVKWLDYRYGEEGHMLANFGIEGKSYTMENGYPKYTEVITKNPDNLPFGQALAKFTLVGQGGEAFIQDKRYMEQFAALPEQKEAITNWMNAENQKQLPPLTLTAEEGAKISTLMNDIKTYYSEMVLKFILGKESMDKFDNFQKTLSMRGINEVLAVQQAALERFNKR